MIGVPLGVHDDECSGPGQEEGWAMNFVQDRSLKPWGSWYLSVWQIKVKSEKNSFVIRIFLSVQ